MPDLTSVLCVLYLRVTCMHCALHAIQRSLVLSIRCTHDRAALMRSSQLDQRMEHLTCFVGGNLALGVASGAVSGAQADAYLSLAKNLTHTCYSMYHTMPTGDVRLY